MKIQKTMSNQKHSKFQQYLELVIGTSSLWFFVKFELITLLFGSIPGALGLILRKWTYPLILGKVGKGVVLGHHVTLRHPQKIEIADGAIIDDYCMLDAKGTGNKGIKLGAGVFLGRQSIVYCKGGDIILGSRANIGHRCIIFSSNHLTIEEGVLIAADCYLLSGGSYDYQSPVPFVDQDGTGSKAPLVIGKNCWLGAKVIVLDGSSIGEGTVVGAGAVVTMPLESKVLAVGVPAKVVKKIF